MAPGSLQTRLMAAGVLLHSQGKAGFIDHLVLNRACGGGNAKTPLEGFALRRIG